MTKGLRKSAIGVAAIAVLLALGALVLTSRRSPPPRLPSPNGYDDFVKAGRMLPVTRGAYDVISPDELRVLVLTNAEALTTARNGLRHESRARLQYTASWGNAQDDEMIRLKRLADAFRAEGRLARLEGRTNDAARSYLDLVRIAHEGTRGGNLFNALVGHAVEALGLRDLQTLQDSLDATESRQMARALEALDAQRETWREVFDRDSAWARQTFGWGRWLTKRASPKYWNTLRGFTTNFATIDRLRRQAIIELAAHAYELDRSERPKTVADLVPAYLKTIPQDPVTGTNLVYAP